MRGQPLARTRRLFFFLVGAYPMDADMPIYNELFERLGAPVDAPYKPMLRLGEVSKALDAAGGIMNLADLVNMFEARIDDRREFDDYVERTTVKRTVTDANGLPVVQVYLRGMSALFDPPAAAAAAALAAPAAKRAKRAKVVDPDAFVAAEGNTDDEDDYDYGGPAGFDPDDNDEESPPDLGEEN